MSQTDLKDKISLLKLALQGLEENELREMAELSEFRKYPAGHIICREGEYEDVFYVIADGEVIVTQQINKEKGERTLRVGSKGDVVGEMALIQSAPRSATVRTTTACTMLEMNKSDFETILSKSPRMALDIIRITLDRIRANDRMSIKELEKTNKILRHMDRNKLEFIQVAAHELRTPLTVLKGYVDVMQSFPEVKGNEALVGVLAGIAKGADRMHEVVDMMLDVTRIDEEAQVALVPVSVKYVVNTLVKSLEKAAEERNIKITIQHAIDTPDVYANPGMIQKALYHLIVNAIKYTPDGGQIYLSTKPILLDDHVPGVEVTVRDTGIGLDAEHHELIFEKFYQVGSVALHSSGKTSFKGGGPGLGLALVRGVARAHQGKVWVESDGYDEVNFPGSTFYFQLPLNLPGKSE